MKCEYCGEDSWNGMMHKANCPKVVEIERRNMEILSQIDQMVSAEAKLKGQNEELRKALEEAISYLSLEKNYYSEPIKRFREVLNQTKEVNDGN